MERPIEDVPNNMPYVAGLDIGSTTTKLVFLKDRKPQGDYVIHTGGDSRRAGKKILEMALADRSLHPQDIAFLVATGYGRYNIDCEKQISEITCQAKGVKWILPDAEVIIDIGGQDFKVIQLNKTGLVSSFAMNDKCAAGTGRYLELMANLFSMGLDAFGRSADPARGGVEITSVCTVFAETEVIGYVSKGVEENEIITGICAAVARRVYSLAKRLIGDAKSLVLTGGVAKNTGVAEALEQITGRAVQIPPEPQLTAALGAALFAQEAAHETQ